MLHAVIVQTIMSKSQFLVLNLLITNITDKGMTGIIGMLVVMRLNSDVS